MKQTYPEFLEDTENFIFVESKPEQADIIFVPGNGYPQMAEQAARLYKEGMAAWAAAKRTLQCDKSEVFGSFGKRGHI